jgi:serine/threonine protein kinase/Tfp pilus assembly protein PilF
MTPRLETVEEIFHAALDYPPDELSAFLDETCAGDEVLRQKVEELLGAHRDAGDFIETPVADLASSSIGNDHESDPLIGQTIGHYKISERISAGGMGEVYLATDTIVGRKAALKFLHARFTGDAARLKRFEQEAHVVAGLNHPNVLTVYEIGEIHSTFYIASELIDGETLRQHLSRGRMEVDEAVDVAIQVAGALAAAHSAGIVHRDVKPENIMLRPDGYMKVLDFGIAKLAEQELPETLAEDEALLMVETNLGSVLGTVRYMSPEQARGASVDKRTDIWSLGVVLYEMVTGRAPFNGDTPGEVMASILSAEPPSLARYLPQASGALQQIVSKALQKDPGQRYQNANEMLDALKGLRRKLEFTAELKRSAAMPIWLRWVRSPTALVLTLVVGALALAFPFFWLRKPIVRSPPEKSIAVLPFQNLSKEQENAFFADGVQDEILTSLSHVADLKVISRTSVMQYKGPAKRNLREIAQQLGVANVVEGSVQRVGNRVRVNAQLIDARTDAHLWAQSYDRSVADVFAVQSDIARSIADQLQAKISAGEKAEIAQVPTTDVVANSLYAQARVLELTHPPPKNLPAAAELLEQAVKRDPQFVLAYCLLSRVHLLLFAGGYDHTPARRELAQAAVETAAQLQPDSGEVHLALARFAYYGFLDYDRARAELNFARHSLPNAPELFLITAQIDRRQGRWSDAISNFERALELDPRNAKFHGNTGGTYELLRRYAEASRYFQRAAAIAVTQPSHFFRLLEAYQSFLGRADLGPLRRELAAAGAEESAREELFVDLSFRCAMAERDPAAIERALGSIPAEGIGPYGQNAVYPREWFAGLAARELNNTAAAHESFTAARVIAEKLVRDQPDYAPTWSLLGQIDAALGSKDEAVREGRRACELLPISKDAVVGAGLITNLAVIYAWTGEKDLAIEQLALSTRIPAGVSYGELKLDPQWDDLRGDPRFETIVASLAPKR